MSRPPQTGQAVVTGDWGSDAIDPGTGFTSDVF